MRIFLWAVVAASASLALCGCTKEKQFRKVTVPVTGMVTVDGTAPDTPLKIDCHCKTGLDREHPTLSFGMTADHGKFAMSTYESGDGVPPGEYSMTFMWGQLNLVSMGYGGPDRLKKRYADPEKSTIKFTVEEGKPVDLGTIALTTK